LLPLLYRNSARLYTWLFQTSAATLGEVAANPRHLGAEIGALSILHTWGQTLVRHPHVQCVVPVGGLSADHQRWVRPPYAGFFLPVRVLSPVFRGKFVAALRRAYLRRTCARLCHLAGGQLDQIQFLLGHVATQTTERYFGCKRRLRCAVNDRRGIEPDVA
jgi:hypothetical protein